MIPKCENCPCLFFDPASTKPPCAELIDQKKSAEAMLAAAMDKLSVVRESQCTPETCQWVSRVRDLESQLAERTEERDEARRELCEELTTSVEIPNGLLYDARVQFVAASRGWQYLYAPAAHDGAGEGQLTSAREAGARDAFEWANGDNSRYEVLDVSECHASYDSAYPVDTEEVIRAFLATRASEKGKGGE